MMRWLPMTACLALVSPAFSAEPPKVNVTTNPAARMRYALSVAITDAPGAFDRVEANVTYRVANDSCVPLLKVMGATVAPTHREPVVLTATGDHTYQGEFFADRLKDEDYFDKGTCHWSVVSVDVEARKGKMDFSSSLFNSELFAQKEVSRYYAQRAYAADQTALVNTGNADRNQFKDPSHAFAITLHAVAKPLSPGVTHGN
ncbi:hypothetical protein L2Y96_07335 [Luteibacter aegosomaticola]|uniref:hypothetical protein n=1 Tax=Luteibacter aegosomaticola TaxID=2911538 RepID=UPI001FF8746B|nr:hypothetical protein [Luteibacter aegosomaticola]UPG91575.1 hypothetical protein L2Y96_07335 [Luteibacter aegosomaticola]